MNVSDLVFGLMASQSKQEYSFEDLRWLTAPFQVTEATLRTNLSRMTANGVIQTSHQGRMAFYSFGDKGQRIRSNVAHGFVALDWSGWDGTYWGVIFSVPDTHGEERHYIRKKLTKYRFALLNPGFWIRPCHPSESIPQTLHTLLSSGYCRLIRFSNHSEFTAEQMIRMWNLRAVNRQFIKVLALIEESEKKLPFLSADQALAERMNVGNTAIQTIFNDPMLPPQFLPQNWQGDHIRKQYRRFDSLAAACSKPYWEKIYQKEDTK